MGSNLLTALQRWRTSATRGQSHPLSTTDTRIGEPVMDQAERVVYELWVILGDLCIAPGASGGKKTQATDCIRRALATSKEGNQ